MKYWGLLVSLATMGMGVAFPAYKSVEAVESEGVLDDTQWLTYWLVAAFMTIFERFAYKVLFRIPLYGESKLLLICWLVLPMTSGAKALYDIARPYIIDFYHAVNNSAHELQSDDPNVKKMSDLRKQVSEVKLGMQKTVDRLLLDAVQAGDSSKLEDKLEEYRSLNA